jgi:MarR family transcriptional regulator, transcriptional regulator for hemolysin
MPAPPGPPLGLLLTRSARLVERAFDDALAKVGGTTSMWLTLLAVKTGRGRNQRELAAVIGIHGATLTHHLNGMERAGLLLRQRQPDNRRQHRVELTDAGLALFHACRKAATAFDQQLREDLDPNKLAEFADTLDQLRRNAAPGSHSPSGPLA